MEDAGEILGGRRRPGAGAGARARATGVRRVRVAGVLDHEDGCSPRRQAPSQGTMGEDRCRPGGAEKLRQPARWVGRVEGQIGAARLEDPQQRNRQVERTIGEDGDHRLRPDPRPAQAAGQGARAAADLGVGETAAAADDRDGIGGRRRLRRELPVDGAPAAHAGVGVAVPPFPGGLHDSAI